jgi:hypothetical protein
MAQDSTVMLFLIGNAMFFLTIVVFGMTTLAVEAGCETITATDMATPKPNAAVAIPLYMAGSFPRNVSMWGERYATVLELVLNGLFIFCLGSDTAAIGGKHQTRTMVP